MAQSLQEPIRRQQKGREAHEKAINEIHLSVAPVCSRSARSRRRTTQGNPALPPGIERLQMRKVYYNLMRKLTLILPFLAASLLVAQQGTSHHPSSVNTTSLKAHTSSLRAGKTRCPSKNDARTHLLRPAKPIRASEFRASVRA